MEKKENLCSNIGLSLTVPFQPIILPCFVPYYSYCENEAKRNIREGRNDNRSGYDGFEERTDNVANEDTNDTNTNTNES